MGVVGSSSYVEAVRELQVQIEQGLLPEPEAIVVALGTGSTAAGLLVGLATGTLGSKLHAVAAANSRWLRASVVLQAWRLARYLGLNVSWQELSARLLIDGSQAGDGYGVPTAAGSAALESARSVGLELEPTYTAKAFAAALQRSRSAAGPTLYWHTLSAHSMAPLLEGAPELFELAPELRALLRAET
jgi:D-cysteine desulfhydrase